MTRIAFSTLLLAAISCGAVFAAEPDAARAAESQSGYSKLEQFGGPDGVSGQLIESDRKRESIYEFKSFKPWFDWKGKIQNEYGVALGFFFSVLYQNASDTLAGQDDDTLGGIYRFQGSWTIINPGGKNPGRIEWRIENRGNIGSFQSSSQLSGAIGIAALNTGFAYADNFKTDLSVFNWTQGFGDDTVGLAVGRLAFDVYLDAMPFQTFSRGFLNRAFVVNPTIGTTGIGALGFVSKGFVTENIIIGGHIYDGNAVSGEFDFDTFQEHEFLKAVEFGWTPSYARRKLDKIQFTYWDKDARVKAGVPSGHGWAVSANWQVGDKWLPFVRFGHSNGGAGVAAESALSGGFEYTMRKDQAWTFGVGWAEPANKPPGTKDEYVIETSYKFQIAKNFSLLPDMQLVIDPANNPTESSVWILGLRAILTL
jgi:porin